MKKLDREENDLRAKTAAHLKAGNRQLAGDFALKLRKVDAEHDDVKEQLEDAEKHYKELIRARDVSAKEARDKIQELRRGIDDMKVKKAVAELNEMASGMISDIGGSGDNLNRLGEIVEEERTKAAGRARVAKDSMDLTEVNMKQEEQDALAEMALADFAAMEGIEIEKTETKAPAKSSEQSASSQGTMGPGVAE